MNNSFSKTNLFKIFCLLFLLTPIAITVIYSFNDSEIVTIWKGFTFKYYFHLFEDEYLLKSLALSFKIAIISASISVIIGLTIANFLKKTEKSFFYKLLTIQIMLPDVITGLGVIMLIITTSVMFKIKLKLEYYGIILSHVIVSLPYVVIILINKLKHLNQEIIESAIDLGANRRVIWLKIILPIIRSSLITCWIISFIISMDDVVLASFTSGPGATTLPMQIYSKLRYGMSPEINALATILIIINLVIILRIVKLNKDKS